VTHRNGDVQSIVRNASISYQYKFNLPAIRSIAARLNIGSQAKNKINEDSKSESIHIMTTCHTESRVFCAFQHKYLPSEEQQVKCYKSILLFNINWRHQLLLYYDIIIIIIQQDNFIESTAWFINTIIYLI